ncbi:hypothetical protein GCK72_010225 [Caenorhabditis remanei]|uniref:Uncharacterized protein n=1 Tax=Caenorhabditis remanei TaxID=31234 RepID=A0A6A5H4M4_CAERE|nr:hypothetical protein GCK72_010225 [Caenorhabditis remanei]KAF1761965.1 hypothetical protein GCK72_010225 [Caenorhabditis remanei]
MEEGDIRMDLNVGYQDTQRDDYDPEVTDAPAVPPFNPLQTPPNEDSHYDNASLRRETSIREAKSDTDQTRTCSSLNEKSVYSPKTNATQDKSLEKLDDPDMRTAREDLWN